MKAFFLLAIVTISMVIAGCVPSRATKLAYLNDNPGTNATARRCILENRVVTGMTTAEVRASWGPPLRINASSGPFGYREQWVYETSYLYFVDGVLNSWQSSR